jgi:hypothetical protein
MRPHVQMNRLGFLENGPGVPIKRARRRGVDPSAVGFYIDMRGHVKAVTCAVSCNQRIGGLTGLTGFTNKNGFQQQICFHEFW